MEKFVEYLREIYDSKNGTINSYKKAIEILDDIFKHYDVLNLSHSSIVDIKDMGEIQRLYEFVKAEERKMKNGEDSIFKFGKPNQKSYSAKGFCSAAVRSLFYYRESIIQKEAIECTKKIGNSSELIKQLKKITSIADTEANVEVQQRIGQSAFRSILLEIYRNRCCVCRLNIKEVLRASHILPWAENKENRLNPENGLCLSATYDAAFDKHLISFDDDYRMVVSPRIREFYTNEAAKEYFQRYEGQQLELPYKFKPNKNFLRKHLSKLKV